MKPVCVGSTCLLLAFGLFPAEAQTMKRILSTNTPAHQASLKYMRGINLGNSLEYAVGNPAGNITYSAADFTLIRSEGFDHVRRAVAGHAGSRR